MPAHDCKPELVDAWLSWRGFVDCASSQRVWSAEELRRESDRLATVLAKNGLRQGDIVGIAIANSATFPVVLFSLLQIGCNPALLFAGSREMEFARTSADLGMAWLLHDFAEDVSQISPETFRAVARAEPAGTAIALLAMSPGEATPAVNSSGLILHSTSGTYGAAQFCVRNQYVAVAEARNYVDTIRSYARVRVRVTTPLSHAFAYGFGLVSCLLTDSTLVVEPSFNPRRLLRRERETKSDIMAIVPPMAKALAQMRSGGCVAEKTFYAGAPCPANVAADFGAAFDAPLFAIYGTTETGAISTTHAPKSLSGSGHPLNNVAVRIDSQHRYDSLGADIGEILVQSTSMMQGYIAAGEVERGAWWPTGDIGRLGEDGSVSVLGRIKDMINLGGMKVDPRDVELVLLRHAQVSDAAVYPGMRADGSEFVQAVLHIHGDSIDLDHIRRHCVEQLDMHKVPARFHIVNAIPRTSSGKCLKVQCPDFPDALRVR